MKKNVSLLLFLLLVFTVGSAFYLTRTSTAPETESAKATLITPAEGEDLDSLKHAK